MAENHPSSSSPPAREQTAAELMRQLSDQTVTLVRAELALAKAELTEKGKQAGKGAGMFGGAGALGFFALGAVTAAVILLLSSAITAWLAALIVGVVYAAVAAGLALSAKNKLKQGTPVPEQTVDSVKEDISWTKQRATSAKK